jgi:hypothetical protein
LETSAFGPEGMKNTGAEPAGGYGGGGGHGGGMGGGGGGGMHGGGGHGGGGSPHGGGGHGGSAAMSEPFKLSFAIKLSEKPIASK